MRRIDHVFAGPEGILRSAVVVAPHVDRLFRNHGEAIAGGSGRNGMRQIARSGIIHAGIDQAQDMARPRYHVPLSGTRIGRTDRIGRIALDLITDDGAKNVIRLAHAGAADAETGP